MSGYTDMINEIYEDLTVIEYLGKDNSKNNIYRCNCVCGKQIIAQASDIRKGKVRSCGCGKFKKSQKSLLDNPDNSIGNSIYRDYKYKAIKHRDIEFTLSPDQFKSMLKDKCFYCGKKEVSYHKSRKKIIDGYIFRYNGIDRVDNDKGYIQGNVVTCCKYCNQAKHSMTQQHFKEMVTNIYHHFVLKKETNE